MVAQKALEAGYPAPSAKLLDETTELEVGGVKIQTYYPGHSQDNLTVWLPGSKVLSAGCFIKSLETKNLRNTTDAVLHAQPNSLKNSTKNTPAPPPSSPATENRAISV